MRVGTGKLVIDVMCTEVMAMAIAALIYYAGGLGSALQLAALVAASTISVSAVSIMLSANRKAYRQRTEGEEFFRYLHSVVYRKRRGGAYAKAALAAARSIRYAALREKVLRSIMRGFMEPRALDGEMGSRRWAASEIEKHERLVGARRAAVEEAAQRYATFNMFISTVLPSFMIFAFIGSSVLSSASFSIVAFSATLLLAVPFFYSLGNLLMWRRLSV
ncbi:MAG: hypothetical protein KGI04_03765 [Candidatus Micrarchaeota archaeon]|nr:hypothetical protein [Candidatus Micrarchaeota archaeon]